jgi:plasmid stabilization system protein ParE
MLREVELDRRVESDLAAIEASISTRVSPTSAARWLKKLRVAMMELDRSADRFPEAEEAAFFGRKLKMSLVGNKSHVYRVIFEILDDRVIVYRVRHAAQDLLSDDDL